MEENIIGSLRRQKAGFNAFVPHSYPPKSGFSFSPEILKKDNEATRLIRTLKLQTHNL